MWLPIITSESDPPGAASGAERFRREFDRGLPKTRGTDFVEYIPAIENNSSRRVNLSNNMKFSS